MALARWADSRRATLGLADGADFAPESAERRTMTQPAWTRLRAALAGAAAPHATAPRADVTSQWIKALAPLLGLDQADAALLRLVLLYRAHTPLIVSLVDDFSSACGRPRDLGADVSLLSLLLDLPPETLAERLRPAAPLLSSGLVRIDQEQDLQALRALVWLARPTPAHLAPVADSRPKTMCRQTLSVRPTTS